MRDEVHTENKYCLFCQQMALVMFILFILKLIQYTTVTRVNEKLNIIPHIEILRELIKKDRLFEKRSDLVFSIREVED